MSESEQRIMEALARLETKLDFHKEAIEKYEERIARLERKMWTSLGAALLAITAYIKSLFE